MSWSSKLKLGFSLFDLLICNLFSILSTESKVLPKGKISQFVLAKVEKTGSSTLSSMLFRFVTENKLNLLAVKHGFHIDWKTERGPGKYSRHDKLD